MSIRPLRDFVCCFFSQMSQLDNYLRAHLACKTCGGTVRIDRHASNAIGAVGQWHMRCNGSCPSRAHRLPVLETSARLSAAHPDDFEVNHRAVHASITCAMGGHEPLSDFLRAQGMGGVSSRHVAAYKEMLEDVAAHQSQASMAAAVELEEKELSVLCADAGDIRATRRGCFHVDGGYSHNRNGHHCTMPAMASGSNRIIACVQARRNDPGATSSQGLEKRCFTALLAHPLIKRLVKEGRYYQVGMDGAQPLIAAAQAAGLEVAGDGWHAGKNRSKYFKKHVDAWSPREGPTARERTFKEMVRVTKPKEKKPVLEDGVAPSEEQKTILREWEAYDGYVEAGKSAKADREARAKTQATIKEAKKVAGAWEVELRGMYRYVFEHVAALRGQTNPATSNTWSKAERTALAIRLLPEASLALMVGQTNHKTLELLNHPAAKGKDEAFSWKAPSGGFVEYGGLVWEIMESWVMNPTCLSKFSFYIDNRMTAGCESWMSKLRVFVPKRKHFARFYSLGVFMAILDHNENVARHVRGERWRRGQSLRHPGRWYKTKIREPTTDVWRGELWDAVLAKERGARASDGAMDEATRGYVMHSPPAVVDLVEGATAADPMILDESPGEGEGETGDVGGGEAGTSTEPMVSAAAARVAAAVTESARGASAAAFGRLGMSASGEVLPLTGIPLMKLEELQQKLRGMGLSATGKKAELVSRLEAAAAELEGGGGMEVEEEGEEGEGDEAVDEEERDAGTVVGPAWPLSPAEAAKAAGVQLEWHILACGECGAGLQVRLPAPCTRVRCGGCGITFFAFNKHVQLAPEPAAPKKVGRKREQSEYVARKELQAPEGGQPDLQAQGSAHGSHGRVECSAWCGTR